MQLTFGRTLLLVPPQFAVFIPVRGGVSAPPLTMSAALAAGQSAETDLSFYTVRPQGGRVEKD